MSKSHTQTTKPSSAQIQKHVHIDVQSSQCIAHIHIVVCKTHMQQASLEPMCSQQQIKRQGKCWQKNTDSKSIFHN